MINLWHTTLCACTHSDDPAYLERTCRVLRYMNTVAKFGRTMLFCHVPPPPWFEGEAVQIPRLDRDQCNLMIRWMSYPLQQTDYTMTIHEDGFILEPDLWTPTFLSYDFIGAPWPDHVVGNNGFCIYSNRFFDALRLLPFDDVHSIQPCDVFLFRTHAKRLTDLGVKIAPYPIAQMFSVEQTGRGTRSFGFHGRTAVPEKYAEGWMKIEQSELKP